jgi:hypothetical protein
MKHRLLLACLLLLLPLGSAIGKGIPWAKVDASSARITEVSATSIAVKSAKVVHSYKITKLTRIVVDGRRAGAEKLRKGMFASVTPSQLEPDTAISIDARSGKE